MNFLKGIITPAETGKGVLSSLASNLELRCEIYLTGIAQWSVLFYIYHIYVCLCEIDNPLKSICTGVTESVNLIVFKFQMLGGKMSHSVNERKRTGVTPNLP
jgi:hypothetical protein